MMNWSKGKKIIAALALGILFVAIQISVFRKVAQNVQETHYENTNETTAAASTSGGIGPGDLSTPPPPIAAAVVNKEDKGGETRDKDKDQQEQHKDQHPAKDIAIM
eukprot:10501502-Ditylum_brightwellii.AAC.1